MTSLEKFLGQSLGSVASLGWFGFSADPPTLAHRAVVDAVLGSGLIQKVIVFPAGQLSYKRFEASDWQRKEMVELWKAAADFGDEVVISTFDLLRPKAIAWYDLWRRINEISPHTRHYLIIGSDQYEEIARSWTQGRKLFDLGTFLIVPRVGFEVTPLRPQHILLPIEPLPGSSTQVRRGDFSYVDERVKGSILEHGLYRHS